MTRELEAQLRRLAELRAERVAAHIPAHRPRHASPGRQPRVILVTAVVGVAAVLVAAIVVVRTDDRAPSIDAPVSSPDGRAVPTEDLWRPVPVDSWAELPSGSAFGQTFPVAVWTGHELVVWGGETESERSWTAAGSIYSPATGTWRDMAASPLAPQSEHVAVWTGDEILICCGRTPRTDSGPTVARAAAAAYRPDDDSWRRIADPKFEPQFAVAGWSGREMFVAGGIYGRGVRPNQRAAMYDPATDEWREVAPAPAVIERNADIAFTGDAFIIWPRLTSTPGLVYDVDRDEWFELPRLPPGLNVHAASMVWTGREILVWGVSASDPTDARGARLSLDEQAWRPIADDPLPPLRSWEGLPGSNAAVWTGHEMLVWALWDGAVPSGSGTPILAYNPDTDIWRRLPDAPTTSYHPILLWAHDTAIVIGGAKNLAFRVSTP